MPVIRSMRRLSLRASLGVWAILLVCAWLDASHPLVVHQASLFAWVWKALQVVAEVLGVIGGAVAASLEAAVVWLAQMVGWLARRTANILASTGGMFARAWEGLRKVYFDVLRPALVQLYRWIRDLQEWLKRTLTPVYRILKRVHDKVLRVWDRYLRPWLEFVDKVRIGLRILGRLGVDWARKLDRTLEAWERVLIDHYLQLVAAVNQVIDLVNDVVTFDRLFARLPFIRSMDRDVAYWVRIWWNRQIVAHTPLPGRNPKNPKFSRRPFVADLAEFRALVTKDEGRFAPAVDELVAELRFNLEGATREETGT